MSPADAVDAFPAESILWLIRRRGYRVWLGDDEARRARAPSPLGDCTMIFYADTIPTWLKDAIALNFWELRTLMQDGFLGNWR